ncbi:MAG: hypothetical protein ACO1OB_03640 [Archangium sp.]
MKKENRTLLLVFAAVFGLGCLATGVIAFLLLRAVDSFGGTDEWSATAVAERDLPTLYGVKLPTAPLRWDSRAMGFQDGFWEVLVKLPPSSREAFVSMNKLEVLTDEHAGTNEDTLEHIRELEPATPALNMTRVKLPEATSPDGGWVNLYRSATFFEADGVFWIHLVAHES